MKKLLIIISIVIALFVIGISISTQINKDKISQAEEQSKKTQYQPQAQKAAPNQQGSFAAPDPSNYILKAGEFNKIDSIHYASGSAEIIRKDGKLSLELKNFSAAQGPDLYMYLVTEDSLADVDFENEKQAINLGKLISNNGDQTYEIPEGYTGEQLKKAVIWCKAFDVVFSFADLYQVAY